MDARYAVVLEPDEDAFQVIVPAFPEIHTFGETVEDALAMARDAIELSIAVRRDEGTEIPLPDAGEARLETVAVNPHAA
jgi:predicted RNase H-like HicB family nuclease